MIYPSFVSRKSIPVTLANNHQQANDSSVGYFARPGDGGILRDPINVRAGWYGTDLASKPDEWRTELSSAEAAELRDTVTKAYSLVSSQSKPLSTVTSSDLPLTPSLALVVDRLILELGGGMDGLGMHILRGIPVDDWSPEETKFFFVAFGRYLGSPVPQAKDGLLVQDVRSTGGGDPETKRTFQTNLAIDFHCDAIDVVGMLCLQEARAGGRSRVVSSVTAHNEFLRRRPGMIERLYRPFLMDVRSPKLSFVVPITPIRYSGNGVLRTFYMPDYFRSAYQCTHSPHGGRMPECDVQVLDAYDAVLDDPRLYLDTELKRGDMQLLNNHTVMHARTALKDGEGEGQTRHLLRLWLSREGGRQGEEMWRQTVSRKLDAAICRGRFAWAVLQRALWGQASSKQLR